MIKHKAKSAVSGLNTVPVYASLCLTMRQEAEIILALKTFTTLKTIFSSNN